MKIISIVIPAYNEQDNIVKIREEIDLVFKTMPHYNYQIIFVNDGSRDGTQEIIEKMSAEFPEVKYLEFSRNFGHQNAVMAGYSHANGNAVISMDADLQHPPSLLPEMIKKWEEGFDVVYTIRTYGETTSFFKRKTSDFFYYFLRSISDVELEKGSSDFRLIDSCVVEKIREFGETDIFIRGLLKWVGFRQCSIPFVAADRFAGESKYNLSKMFRFAFTGITAFSVKPLYFAAYLGFFFSCLSLLYIPYVVIAFIRNTEISGWASILMTIVFFGGLQLIILGIIGIYLGKVFKQMKNRPNYIIRSKK